MESLIINILRLVSFAFIARALLSWFRIKADSPFRPVSDFLHDVTEPVLLPIRRVLPPMGGFDLSVLIVILGINYLLIPVVASIL